MSGLKLTYILPFISLLVFFYALNKRCTVQTYLLSILYLLPLINLRITSDEWGGFTTFDAINFFCFFFFLKEFDAVPKTKQTYYYFFLSILFIFIAIIGTLASEFPETSILALIKLLPIFIYARFLSAECAASSDFVQRVVKAFKFGYFVALGFLIIQLIWGLELTFYSSLGDNTMMAESNVIRYPGFFFDSQLNGQYLAMVSFIFLFNTKKSSPNDNVLNYAIFGIAILAIFLAGSRSAFGGFCFGLLVVFLWAGSQYRIFLTILLFVGLGYYMVFAPTSGVFNRSNSLDEDYKFRQSIWHEAIEIAENHPFVGIGVGNYKSYITKYNQDQYLLLDDELVYFDQPENGYLKILVEFGYLGFGVFVLLILSPLVTGLQFLLKNFDHKVSLLIAGVVSWLVAFNTVYSIWDYRILMSVATILILLMTYPEKKHNAI